MSLPLLSALFPFSVSVSVLHSPSHENLLSSQVSPPTVIWYLQSVTKFCSLNFFYIHKLFPLPSTTSEISGLHHHYPATVTWVAPKPPHQTSHLRLLHFPHAATVRSGPKLTPSLCLHRLLIKAQPIFVMLWCLFLQGQLPASGITSLTESHSTV